MILRNPSSPAWMKAFMLLSICTLITFTSGAQGQKSRGKGNQVFTTVEHPAIFPGGDVAFSAYLVKSIRYPQDAKSSQIRGKVFVNFIVERNGSLSRVKVVKGIGYGCDEEAMRVIKASPKWIPAKQKGSIVRQQFTVPIKFSISKT